MPSTNKTPYLNLNQWLGTDKPKRDDFCQDNQKIDTKIRLHCEDSELHASFTTGSYTGNGSSSRTIPLGFAPRLLLLYCDGHGPAEVPGANTANIFTGFYSPLGATAGLSISGSTMTVVQATVPVPGYATPYLNMNNAKYVYIAFR